MDEQAALSCCVTYLLLPLKLLNFSEMRISENCESFQWRESFCDAAGFARSTARCDRNKLLVSARWRSWTLFDPAKPAVARATLILNARAALARVAVQVCPSFAQEASEMRHEINTLPAFVDFAVHVGAYRLVVARQRFAAFNSL